MSGKSGPHEPLINRATQWLNDKLMPVFGPPPLGPYDPESPEPTSSKSCPICLHPMKEHRAEWDAETGHLFLQHPDVEFPGEMQVR
jgi:hypothetical protein